MLLLDSNSILVRYFFALGGNVTDMGPLLQAFAFCVNRLHKQNPREPIFFFDACVNNFRKQINADYKAQRKKLPAEFFKALADLRIYLVECGFNVFFHDQYEADDLIACFIESQDFQEYTIVSTDKDLLQLVDDGIEESGKIVSVLNPFKNITMRSQDVFNQYGIYPRDFALYLSMVGDSSDNIKGIRGFGPKRAVLEIRNNVDYWYLNPPEDLKITTIYRSLGLEYVSNNLSVKNRIQNLSDRILSGLS